MHPAAYPSAMSMDRPHPVVTLTNPPVAAHFADPLPPRALARDLYDGGGAGGGAGFDPPSLIEVGILQNK
eukprot:1086111-Prorocentrum_minimum.AAC.1